MVKKRFSKEAALEVLDRRAARIRQEQKFDRCHGTSQLGPMQPKEIEDIIKRAVEYGRMRAFEQFAEAIREGFSLEAPQD